MIQRSYDITNESEFLWTIQTIKTALENEKGKNIFLQILFSRFSKEEAESVLQILRSELPNTKILGMSVYGDLVKNLNSKKFIRINSIIFSQSHITLMEYDNRFIKIEDMVKEFKSTLSSISDAKGVLLLGSGSTLKISSFVQEASEGFENIHFFGTTASMNISDSYEPYVIGRKIIFRGIALAIFSGKELEIFSESFFNWNPIGKSMEVHVSQPQKRSSAFISMMDRARGLNLDTENECEIGDTIVTTIDGLPATQIYKKYLNVDPDSHFISNICEFPLALERNGKIMARVPCGFNGKGEIFTIGDIKDGEKVRFTYAKTDELIQKTSEESIQMAEFFPEAIFLFVCANRAIFMKKRAHEEIDLYKRINPNALYSHGFCEIHRHKNTGGVFNSQLVTVGMREGKIKGNINASLSGNSFSSPLFSLPISFELKEEKKQKEKENLQNLSNSSYTKSRGISDYVTTNTRESVESSIPLSERLITFLEATTADLKAAEENANAASQAKSDFLSNMSHEIRTPINAVLGLDEMILRETSEPIIKGYARDIQSSGRSLLSIINDILDFSKIEAGKMEIINAQYDLRRMITDLTNMIEFKAKNKNLEFIVDVDANMPHTLYGDETRINQCVLNILTNAVKYTKKGSVSLKVSYKKNGEESILLIFSVKDTGIGIKQEDLKKLFSPFERIEENANRNIEGTGLGMSIVKGLLGKMGSELKVESEYSKGSTFTFEVEQKVLDWEEIGNAQTARKALTDEIEQYRESFQAPEAKILVVDDTPMNLTVIKGLLKNTRIQIDTASSADEGLSLADKTKYDIIFADHLMPKKDGIEMLKELREKSELNKNTICIALTANAISGAKEMYLKSGFSDYLSKPLDPKKLEEMIAANLPKKLVLKKGDSDFIETKSDELRSSNSELKSSNSAENLLSKILRIDFSEAIKNCGSEDIFLSATKLFYETIEEKSSQIEDYVKSNDWENFTIQVHALKSSARLIGAKELSEKAKELEELGRKKDSKKEIQKKTPKLLELYKAYENTLPLLFEKVPYLLAEKNNNKKNQTQNPKGKLSSQELEEAFTSLGEVISIFDFNTAEAIISQLEDYDIPEEKKEKYNKLKKAVQNVDQNEVLKILAEKKSK